MFIFVQLVRFFAARNCSVEIVADDKQRNASYLSFTSALTSGVLFKNNAIES